MCSSNDGGSTGGRHCGDAVIVASDEIVAEDVEFLATGRARGNWGEAPR